VVTEAGIREVTIEARREEANSAKSNQPENDDRERSIQRLNEMCDQKIKKATFERWKEFIME